MKALISIHDVMPETLDRVEALVERLAGQGHTAITLLVVPGRAWQPADLDVLRAWQAAGIELAAHGWQHHVSPIRGLRHRLHAALISRNVAEHLALDEDGRLRLMQAAATWFDAQGLAPPLTYVPPAWALGRIRRRRLRTLPYQRIEVTRGLLDCHSGRLQSLPLVGFEADTAARALALRAWNRTQFALARQVGRALRIAIHPDDAALHLATDLDRCLQRPWQALRTMDVGSGRESEPAVRDAAKTPGSHGRGA